MCVPASRTRGLSLASRPPHAPLEATTQPATCSAPRAADFYEKRATQRPAQSTQHAQPAKAALDAERVLGAWQLHEPVLRHYGVPTVLVGAALQEETRRLGLPAEGYGAPFTGTLAHPLSRHWLLQDKVHLSAEGHQLTAMLTRTPKGLLRTVVLYVRATRTSLLPVPYVPETQWSACPEAPRTVRTA